MFSSTTIALSTTMPTANASPASEMTLSVRFHREHDEERADDRDRDRQADDRRRHEGARKSMSTTPAIAPADEQVARHQVDRRVDVGRLVVN
ncbi:MAG: hypothetical protein R3B49_05830 [Phycisphaerales bacterium]